MGGLGHGLGFISDPSPTQIIIELEKMTRLIFKSKKLIPNIHILWAGLIRSGGLFNP